MPNTLDLNLLPMVRSAGQDGNDLSGLTVTAPPRQTTRGRSADNLLLYLELEGNSPLSPGKQGQLLAQIAKTYYETAGSVTTALRVSVEALNQFLLERNVRNANTGRQSVGLFSIAVFREEQLTLAMCGPVWAFVLSANGVQEIHDQDMEGRGLGQSRGAPLRFYQVSLRPNDTLILSIAPPSTWNTAGLKGLFGQGPESLRRRLMSRAGIDLSAVLVQAKPGTGKIVSLRSHTSSLAARAGEFDGDEDEGQSLSVTIASLPTPNDVQSSASPSKERLSPPVPPAATPDVALLASVQPVVSGPDSGVADEPPQMSAPPAVRRRSGGSNRRSFSLAPFGALLVSLGRPFNWLNIRLGRVFQWIIERLVPEESFASIPTSTMAFVAIAVPVIVVAMATVIYRQQGLRVQSMEIYQRAVIAARQAEGQTDPGARRAQFETTLQLIDQSNAFYRMPEAEDLLGRVHSSLDELELVKRATFSPAIIGGLPDTIQITRIVIALNDLYLLDGKSGNVLHALVTAHGYEIDRAFQCGPNPLAPSPIGPLIDLATLPPENKQGAVVIGMDAKGNLLYCTPGKPPSVATLASPTIAPLGRPLAFAQDGGDLYVLDPSSKAVWIYWNGEVAQAPQFFFSGDVPPLQDVIDLAVNSDELYLLHRDGHLTLCYFSAYATVSPTRCSDPAQYSDLRPGRENTPMNPANPFSQIIFSPPPDPSLFFLEPEDQAIFHFSLRNLVFQRQFLPGNIKERALPNGKATAFAVNQVDRMLFLAVNNQVFYANIP